MTPGYKEFLPKIRHLRRNQSYRLKGWDYSNPGWYYFTICCRKHRCYLGKIRHNIMGLSIPGCIAWYYWRQIPNHHPNVVLDTFIVMPNHIHGIIGIQALDYGLKPEGTCHGMSLPHRAKFGKPQAESLSIILNQYKGAVTKWCHLHHHDYFKWQSRFYDEIIRNEKALDNIRNYILYNPENWRKD